MDLFFSGPNSNGSSTFGSRACSRQLNFIPTYDGGRQTISISVRKRFDFEINFRVLVKGVCLIDAIITYRKSQNVRGGSSQQTCQENDALPMTKGIHFLFVNAMGDFSCGQNDCRQRTTSSFRNVYPAKFIWKVAYSFIGTNYV